MTLAVVAVSASACAGHQATAPTTTQSKGSTSVPTSTTRPPATSTPSTAAGALTVTASAAPNPGSPGRPVTFTIHIQGPGVLSTEDVHFGDGGTTGANAGEVPCGQTPEISVTHTWTHTYTATGTYQFTETAGAIGPPPSCRSEEAAATATVVVS